MQRDKRQESQLPLSEIGRLGGIEGDMYERCYPSGARLDALDELLVREDRVAEESLHVAEEDLHILRISIFDCGEFLSLN